MSNEVKYYDRLLSQEEIRDNYLKAIGATKVEGIANPEWVKDNEGKWLHVGVANNTIYLNGVEVKQ